MSGHLNSNFTALHTIYINYCPYLLIFQRSFKISSFIIITEGERNTLLFPTRDFRIFCPLRLSLDWMFLGVGTVSHRSLSFPPLPWCQGQCFLFFFFNYLFIYACICVCAGSSLLCMDFLCGEDYSLLQDMVSRCSGFPHCGTQALEAWVSVAAACGITSYNMRL